MDMGKGILKLMYEIKNQVFLNMHLLFPLEIIVSPEAREAKLHDILDKIKNCSYKMIKTSSC